MLYRKSLYGWSEGCIFSALLYTAHLCPYRKEIPSAFCYQWPTNWFSRMTNEPLVCWAEVIPTRSCQAKPACTDSQSYPLSNSNCTSLDSDLYWSFIYSLKIWQIRNISVLDIVFCHIQQPKIEILRNNFLLKWKSLALWTLEENNPAVPGRIYITEELNKLNRQEHEPCHFSIYCPLGWALQNPLKRRLVMCLLADA